MTRTELALGTTVAFRAAWSDGSEVPAWGVKSRVPAVELECKLLVSQGQDKAFDPAEAPAQTTPQSTAWRPVSISSLIVL